VELLLLPVLVLVLLLEVRTALVWRGWKRQEQR
jgi:hypothetical protein